MTRLGVGGQTHRLSLVELRILKRRQSEQPVSETRMQSALGDVDLIAENQIQRLRQSANDRRLCWVPRGRSRPRLFFSIVLWRQTHAEDATTPFGLLDDLFNDSAQAAHGKPMARDERLYWEKYRDPLGGTAENWSNTDAS